MLESARAALSDSGNGSPGSRKGILTCDVSAN
jgi:hypothetical protein